MTTNHRRVRQPLRVVLGLSVGGALAVSGAAAAIAAAGGNGQGNSGNGGGNGGSTTTAGSVSPGKAFVVSVASTTQVAPGKAGSVTITVTNPNSQAATLTSLSGAVTGVGSGSNPKLAKCSVSWFTLGAWTGSRSVASNGSSTLTLPVTFADTSANQDNCKGVTYTFSFVVNGQQS